MDSLDEGKWSEKGDFAKAELTYLLSRTMHTTIYICVSFCATDGLSVQLPVPQPYFLLQLQQLWSNRSGKKAGRGGRQPGSAAPAGDCSSSSLGSRMKSLSRPLPD